jgi:hypothetical protein
MAQQVVQIVAPFFQSHSMTPDGWTSFVRDFESYKARGGQILLTSLVASDVIEIAVLAEGCTSEEIMVENRLSKALTKLFAPKSKAESRSRMAAIQM